MHNIISIKYVGTVNPTQTNILKTLTQHDITQPRPTQPASRPKPSTMEQVAVGSVGGFYRPDSSKADWINGVKKMWIIKQELLVHYCYMSIL